MELCPGTRSSDSSWRSRKTRRSAESLSWLAGSDQNWLRCRWRSARTTYTGGCWSEEPEDIDDEILPAEVWQHYRDLILEVVGNSRIPYTQVDLGEWRFTRIVFDYHCARYAYYKNDRWVYVHEGVDDDYPAFIKS